MRQIRSYPPRRPRLLAGACMYSSARRRPERVVLAAKPLATGADAYIRKPFTLQSLRETLQALYGETVER